MKNPKQSRRTRTSLLIVSTLLVICGGAYLTLTVKKDSKTNIEAQNAIAAQNTIQPLAKKGTVKMFSGDQFKDLYNSFAYPNTQQIIDTTPITSNEAADAKIRQIAIIRGYQIRSAPVSNTFQDVGEGYQLQKRAAQPWLDLQAAAKKDGINLGLTAAYRSADEQRKIFVSRLATQNIPIAAIGLGAHDAQVSEVLRTTAIPGYSRHHTGYTIDISCKDMPASSFMYTTCFKWLSANNYEHAKQHGWIPSYPEGTAKQGPDPESWEYVWVSTDALTD